jgi:hypothetical protein
MIELMTKALDLLERLVEAVELIADSLTEEVEQ